MQTLGTEVMWFYICLHVEFIVEVFFFSLSLKDSANNRNFERSVNASMENDCDTPLLVTKKIAVKMSAPNSCPVVHMEKIILYSGVLFSWVICEYDCL